MSEDFENAVPYENALSFENAVPFESALSTALDHAARAAQPVGPGAARTRGRNRAMRKRIALSAASLIMIAASATATIYLKSSNDGGTPHLTSGTPHTTTSVSASPSITSPQATASGTASSTASTPSSATTTTTTGATQSVSADPHHFVAAAWLSASEMPFADTLGWKAVNAEGGTALTSTVSYIPNTAGYQALTVCGDPAKFVPRTTGLQVASFVSTPTSSGNNQATQYIFFFSDASAAQQGYAWLVDQYTSNCTGITGTGAQVTQVGSDGSTGMAWLTRKATSGLVDLPLYEREYFVLRGNTIAYVSVTSYPHSLSTTYDDAGQLATIAGHMCVYGGSCS